MYRSDGKRPYGLTLVPWQSGKPLIWDVTVVCPLADSYVALAARDPSATEEMAASNKTAKYTGLMSDYHFQPIAVESLGPANESAIHFLVVLGKKIAQQTGDERETAFFPNVTTLGTFGSLLPQFRLSVCLSVVCNVAVEPFGKLSSPLCTLAKFYGDSPRGTPPSGALNARGVSK